jgi:tRNA threonylcarbamoyladenosine biosynthesis protein TsaB
MKILGLDTAMAACSVAVIDTSHALPLASAFVPMERGHAEALAPMVERVMAEAGLEFSALDRIAVTTGPGTFTGVRIGLAMARGLGLALNRPVIGIDSLSAIAANESADSPLLVVSDARNNEVYAALFDAGRELIKPPHVTIAAAAAEGAPEGATILGTAADTVIASSGRNDLVRSAAATLPIAARIAALAADAPGAGMPAPLYLRAPDAKPQPAGLRKAAALKFIEATSVSVPLLAAMHGECFDRPWTEQSFAELLSMPGATATIAMELEEPVGFILTRRAADEAEIIMIATRPHAQRRGVAKILLEHQIAALKSSGVNQLFLEVADSNAAARGLYEALGFKQAGLRRGYYQRPGGSPEDALVLSRNLAGVGSA